MGCLLEVDGPRGPLAWLSWMSDSQPGRSSHTCAHTPRDVWQRLDFDGCGVGAPGIQWAEAQGLLSAPPHAEQIIIQPKMSIVLQLRNHKLG